MVQLVLAHADQYPKLSLQVSKSLLPLHTHAAFSTSLELLFCPIDLDEQLLSNNTLLGLVKVLVEILVRKVVVVGEAYGLLWFLFKQPCDVLFIVSLSCLYIDGSLMLAV